jgi:tRNA U34 5-carboxymethylaminomethyl modifying GTPase MnmE/TrmE
LSQTKGAIKLLLDTYYEGKAIKKGFEVLISANDVGNRAYSMPSSQGKAIVTTIGHNGDLIEDTIHIKGIKIKIIDTAARRPADIC